MGYCEDLVHRRVYTTFLYDSILNWVKTIVDADQTYGPVGSGIGQLSDMQAMLCTSRNRSLLLPSPCCNQAPNPNSNFTW